MSMTYPDLIYTNFPDELSDTFDYLSDLSADQIALANQYKLYLTYNDLASAKQLLADNPSLKSTMIDAEKINKLIDAIKAMQRLYKEDIQSYLIDLVKYKGVYSSTAAYNKYDVVTQTIDGKTLAYMCIMETTVGIQPTNDLYWIPITQQGERGLAGFGLSYAGIYNTTTIYSQYSMVVYDNGLWAALEENVGIVPTDDSPVWERLMGFSVNELSFEDNTLGTQYRLLVDNRKIYLEEV